MAELVSGLRGDAAPTEIAGLAVEGATDYAQGADMPVVRGMCAACGCCDGTSHADEAQRLPGANVVEFRLAGGSKVIVRPSGTEPKVKAYLFAKAPTRGAAEELRDRLAEAAKSLLN